jgi:hypothetical protein
MIDALAQELATEAKIDVAKARRVLDILHVHKVEENLNGLVSLLSNPVAVNALGMAQDQALQIRDAYGKFTLSLKNLRIGIKPAHRAVGGAA